MMTDDVSGIGLWDQSVTYDEEDLPLPDELRRRLRQWVDEYTATIGGENAHWTLDDLYEHDRRGYALSHELQRALGPKHRIEPRSGTTSRDPRNGAASPRLRQVRTSLSVACADGRSAGYLRHSARPASPGTGGHSNTSMEFPDISRRWGCSAKIWTASSCDLASTIAYPVFESVKSSIP